MLVQQLVPLVLKSLLMLPLLLAFCPLRGSAVVRLPFCFLSLLPSANETFL